MSRKIDAAVLARAINSLPPADGRIPCKTVPVFDQFEQGLARYSEPDTAEPETFETVTFVSDLYVSPKLKRVYRWKLVME
jgi:hypothetical protein